MEPKIIKNLNAVIIYLSRRKDINDLRKSLILLYKNFNNKFNYPVIIFHDDFNSKDISLIENIDPKIIFKKLKFEMPTWIDQSKQFNMEWSMGYRHMCRFYSGEIYKFDVMENYDWYWRLDSDSFIHSAIDYDIFEFLEKNGFVYGYLGAILKDGARVVEGLWDFTKKYIYTNNIKPKFLHRYLNETGSWDYSMYYTNFEISRLDFWRSAEYMNFYNNIDENGGIYYNRWGDNVIHWLALSIFVDEKKVHCFKDIDYSHNIFRPNRNYRLYSSLKKYHIYNYLNKKLYFVKYNRFYDIFNRHLFSKYVDILSYFLNYKLIKLQVYTKEYR